MSKLSIAAYFPFRPMKAVYQSLPGQSSEALVRLEPDLLFRARCSACGGLARSVHSKTRKFLRDLGFGQRRMLLHLEYRKVYCDACHGVRVERLDFVDTSHRVTHRLGAYAAGLCRLGLPVTAVAEHLGLDPKTVKHFEKASLEGAAGSARSGSECAKGHHRVDSSGQGTIRASLD